MRKATGCRTDTDPIYSSVSDPLPKSSVAFLGTDLDQIGSTSDSKRTILLCSIVLAVSQARPTSVKRGKRVACETRSLVWPLTPQQWDQLHT